MKHFPRKFVAVLTTCLLGSSFTLAQSPQSAHTLSLDPNTQRPKATVADFAWLAGHWSGEGLGGQCEEIWAPPVGDSMIGMFRYLKEGQTQFTEFFSLVKEGESLSLYLKHFHADMKGWEEKDKVVHFPLVKLTPNEAHFDGLTIRKVDADTLTVYVVIKGKDGSLNELEFNYKRMKAP